VLLGKWIKRKPAPLVGLDISSASVKLLELSYNGSRYRVESYAVEPMPPNSVVERAITDPEAVGDAIRRAIKRSGTRAKHAAVAVSGSAVITKIITMPASFSELELESQIELEADQHIPYPLEEVNMDFEVLGPSEKNADTVDVLLAASRSENVDMRVAAVEMGGLTTKVVDIEAYGMENAFSLIAGQMPDQGVNKTIAVVDIGATTTTLNVLHDMRMIYNRDQVFGGKQLTDEIARRFGLSSDEAAVAKHKGGLPETYETEVLVSFKEAMAQHVSRALQFFFSSSHYNHVDHIVLAGGSSVIPGVDKLIEDKVGIDTSIANPFKNMSVAAKVASKALIGDAPAMMLACGLALRSFG